MQQYNITQIGSHAPQSPSLHSTPTPQNPGLFNWTLECADTPFTDKQCATFASVFSIVLFAGIIAFMLYGLRSTLPRSTGATRVDGAERGSTQDIHTSDTKIPMDEQTPAKTTLRPATEYGTASRPVRRASQVTIESDGDPFESEPK